MVLTEWSDTDWVIPVAISCGCGCGWSLSDPWVTCAMPYPSFLSTQICRGCDVAVGWGAATSSSCVDDMSRSSHGHHRVTRLNEKPQPEPWPLACKNQSQSQRPSSRPGLAWLGLWLPGQAGASLSVSAAPLSSHMTHPVGPRLNNIQSHGALPHGLCTTIYSI